MLTKKAVKQVLAGIVAATAFNAAGTASAAITYNVSGNSAGQTLTYWSLAWAAQSLYYAEPVQINSLKGIFKDGATDYLYKFEVFTSYDNATKTFSGKIAETTATVTNASQVTVSFTDTVVLQGSTDGLYYIKWSPATGGVIHQIYQGVTDDGTNPLRHGTAGHLITSNGNFLYYDAPLTLDTTPVPEAATLGLLALGMLGMIRKR